MAITDSSEHWDLLIFRNTILWTHNNSDVSNWQLWGGFIATRANIRLDKAMRTEATAKLAMLTAVTSGSRKTDSRRHHAVLGQFACGSSLEHISYILSGTTLCSDGLSLRLATVDVAAFRGSFLTFPLEKRHDGFHTLNVSSAHWHHPVDSRVPSFKCICSVHSRGENGLLSQPRWVLSNYDFLQILAQFRGHIVNKRLTSGLVRQQHCGKWCVTFSGQ